MSITIDLIFILQSVTVLLVAAGVRGIFTLSQRINTMNGRIGKLEVWANEHEKYNVDAHEEIRREIGVLRQAER